MNFDSKAERAAGDVWVIAFTGEVDLYTAPEFKEQLLDVIAQGATHVVVDLTDTTFIDSTTLGVLVGGVKRLRRMTGSSRSSAATEHHEDLRDHGAEPDLPDPRPTARKRSRAPASPRRSVPRPWCGSSSSSSSPSCCWLRGAVETRRGRPTARTARRSSSRASKALSCGSCHRLGCGHGGHDGAQPRPGVRLQLRAGLRGEHDLLGRARPDRPRGGRDARRPRDGPGRGRRRGLRGQRRRQGHPRLRPERRPGRRRHDRDGVRLALRGAARLGGSAALSASRSTTTWVIGTGRVPARPARSPPSPASSTGPADGSR